MTPPQVVLVVEDDEGILDPLVAVLAQPERSLVACRDLESARLVLERMPITHLVSDIGLASFSYAGLDLIEHARRHAPGAKIILMSGLPAPGLEREARRRGAAAFLKKPFSVDELEAHLAVAAPPPGPRPRSEPMSVPLLDEILADPGLTSVFQPICRLDAPDAPPLGFEALTRLETDTPFRDPELLFRYALEKERAVDFELLCLKRHWSVGAALAAGEALLFANIHPSVLGAGERLVEALLNAPIPPSRLVLELTEQGPIPQTQGARDTVETLRAHGVRFAFDDLGMAYSHLQFLEHIRPAFLKISQHFGMSMATNATSTTVVRSLLDLAKNLSASLILEGIEDMRTLELARELGVPLGQGYLFARPGPAETFLPVPRLSIR